ncbi:MAG TPA: GNAT family N-acetyltransferase [Thermoplasmata archaeon]|nr:GNAT family N-acetyltransferase [Thermoplasmata archaeon]
MDPRRYRLRAFVPADYPAIAQIETRRSADRPHTAAALKERDRTHATTGAARWRGVVEEVAAHTVVGYADALQLPWDGEPGSYWVLVAVDPDHEHRGVGRALADAAERTAADWSARVTRTEVPVDQERGVRFAAARGYVEVRRYWQSKQDVAEVDLDRIPDPGPTLERRGVRFSTYAAEGPDRPGVRAAVYRLYVVASESMPRIGPYRPMARADFESMTLGNRALLSDAFFLAAHGAEYVGMSYLERSLDDPTSLHQLYTGTDPGWRGRGIASALKRRTVEYARAHGVRYIWTANDSRNEAMWRINQRLGYVRRNARMLAERWAVPRPA